MTEQIVDAMRLIEVGQITIDETNNAKMSQYLKERFLMNESNKMILETNVGILEEPSDIDRYKEILKLIQSPPETKTTQIIKQENNYCLRLAEVKKPCNANLIVTKQLDVWRHQLENSDIKYLILDEKSINDINPKAEIRNRQYQLSEQAKQIIDEHQLIIISYNCLHFYPGINISFPNVCWPRIIIDNIYEFTSLVNLSTLFTWFVTDSAIKIVANRHICFHNYFFSYNPLLQDYFTVRRKVN